MPFNECIIHGNLISLNGRGILILGDPEAGKTHLTRELLSLGYRFIADDAVTIRQSSDGHISGFAPERTYGKIVSAAGRIVDLDPGEACGIDLIVSLAPDTQDRIAGLKGLPQIEMNKPSSRVAHELISSVFIKD